MCAKSAPNLRKNVNNKGKISFTLKERMPFTEPIFKKLTPAQQHYTEASSTNFHPNQSRNMASMSRNSFIPLSKV
jgi:hypothetical protein